MVYMGKDLLHAVMNGEDGTLYFIKYVDSSNHTALVTSSRSMHLWHCHMGHLSLSLISTISHCKIVKELELNSPLAFNHLCSGCIHSKFYKLLLSDSSSLSYSKMELVVMDLTGPMSILTWDSNLYALVTVEMSYVRRSSHQDGSLQNRLRDEWTCGMTLASAYVLHRLSAMWSQLQMKRRRSEWM